MHTHTHTHTYACVRAYIHEYMHTYPHRQQARAPRVLAPDCSLARPPAHTFRHSFTHAHAHTSARTHCCECLSAFLSFSHLSLSLCLSVSVRVCLSLLLLLRRLLLLIHESLSFWLSFASLALFLPPLHPLLCLCMQLLFGAGDADALNISSSIRTNLAKHSAQHFQKLFAAFQPQMIRESLTCRTSR